jgi:hypothetical protein
MCGLTLWQTQTAVSRSEPPMSLDGMTMSYIVLKLKKKAFFE